MRAAFDFSLDESEEMEPDLWLPLPHEWSAEAMPAVLSDSAVQATLASGTAPVETSFAPAAAAAAGAAASPAAGPSTFPALRFLSHIAQPAKS